MASKFHPREGEEFELYEEPESLRRSPSKIVMGVVATIIIGAMGSGLWDFSKWLWDIIKPILNIIMKWWH